MQEVKKVSRILSGVADQDTIEEISVALERYVSRVLQEHHILEHMLTTKVDEEKGMYIAILELTIEPKKVLEELEGDVTWLINKE